MANPLTHAKSLPEHATDAGDEVAARITITVFASGAMQVAGNIADLQWALAALDHAKDAIKSEHARKLGAALVPAKDVSLG